MTDLLLRVGDLDLSRAMKVAKDEGMDPADSDFLTPEFGETPFGRGNPLTSLKESNREQAWPLILSARPADLANAVNGVGNSRCHVDTSGHTAQGTGSAIARSSTGDPLFGRTSLLVTQDGSLSGRGSNYSPSVASPDLANLTWCFSVYVKGNGTGTGNTLRLLLREVSGGGTVGDSQQNFTLTTQWQRVHVSRTFGATADDFRLLILNDTAAAFGLRAVGFMLSIGTTPPVYFDGDHFDAAWDGPRHDNNSFSRALTGKDGLHRIQQKFRRAMRQNQTVEFKDIGATSVTFFDSVYTRFDVDYHYRRQAKNWIGGTLKTWVRPYGHSGTYRGVGSALAPSGVVRMPIASLLGDAPAELETTVIPGSAATQGAGGRIVGLGVLPIPSYDPFIGASALLNRAPSSQTRTSANTTPDGRWLQLPSGSVEQTQTLGIVALTPSAYAGRNRVLALVRPTRRGVGAYVHMRDEEDRLAGPTALIGRDLSVQAQRAGFMLTDLGVIDVPTYVPTSLFTVGAGFAEPRISLDADVIYDFSIDDSSSTQNCCDFGGLILLPEDSSQLTMDPTLQPVAQAWFGGTGVGTQPIGNFTDDYGNGTRDSSGLFGVASLLVGASNLYCGPITPAGVSGRAGRSFMMDITRRQSRRVSAVFGFFQSPFVAASGAAGTQTHIRVGLHSGNTDRLYAQIIPLAPGAGVGTHIDFELEAVLYDGFAGGRLRIAPTTSMFLGATYPFRVDVVVNGDTAYANLAWRNASQTIRLASLAGVVPTSVKVASVGLQATALLTLLGRPWVEMAATSVTTPASAWLGLMNLSAQDIVGPRPAASDSYLLGEGRALRSNPTQSFSIEQGKRGPDLTVEPGASQALVAFAIPVDGGPTTDMLDVRVLARERFTYVR